MSDNSVYGIWGGKHPYGWCMFEVRDQYSYFGSEKAALAGWKFFVEENNRRRAGALYDVIPYDPYKEPVANGKKPTELQLQCLTRMHAASKRGTIELDVNYFYRVYRPRSTVDGLIRRGLIMVYPPRVTRAGVAMVDAFCKNAKM